MKTARLISALNKAQIKIEQEAGSNKYHVTGLGSFKGWFHDQNGEAVCVGVLHKGDKIESETDYFPQFYCRSIKEFVSYMQEKLS